MFYRSSYELRALERLEQDPTVREFDTECVSIPYTYNDQQRFYIPDIWVKFRGDYEKLIEVKMKYLREDPVVLTKEIAAQAYCRTQGWDYEVWTEDDLPERRAVV